MSISETKTVHPNQKVKSPKELCEHVDTQLAAVNSASTTARHVYPTFLVFLAYAAVTIWSTTHEQFLRGSGVTLPLLNVEVSIVGFYAIIP